MYICTTLKKIRHTSLTFPGGPRLKAEDVVRHFMLIIKEPKYRCQLGLEYCRHLKNILSVPVYQRDITMKTWQGMATTGTMYFSKNMYNKIPVISLGFIQLHKGIGWAYKKVAGVVLISGEGL